jgi:sarcosine oxidase subunit alpha
MADWRIYDHPILKFERGKEVTIYLEGKPVKAYENETVAAALYASGLREFSESIKYRRPRGFFCAIGRCSSCMMEVDGVPNVRSCMMPVKDGMKIKSQKTPARFLRPILNMMKLPPQKYMRMFTRPGIIYKPAMMVMRQLTGIGETPEEIPEDLDVIPTSKEMETEFLVIGGGPAGLSGAIEAGEHGVNVAIIDDKPMLGGQLVKQTHTFFSDVKYAAGKRGFNLGKQMINKVEQMDNVEMLPNTTAVGYYPNENIMLLVGPNNSSIRVKAKKYLVATGAYENNLVFENNDLPGVYGAGGVQTLLNVYGIKPGNRGIIIGTGNVALMVAYHLIQAGVEVLGVYAPSFRRIKGYPVHAAKIRRHGVPIITRHTIKAALGSNRVTGAVIVGLDEKYNEIEGSEEKIDCDFICIGVGLTPAYDLVSLFDPEMKYVPALGGFIPIRDKQYRFVENAYIAGDCSSIEEATTAILEGGLAGLFSTKSLGRTGLDIDAKIEEYTHALEEDRKSPFSTGLVKAMREVTVENIVEAMT